MTGIQKTRGEKTNDSVRDTMSYDKGEAGEGRGDAPLAPGRVVCDAVGQEVHHCALVVRIHTFHPVLTRVKVWFWWCVANNTSWILK